MINIEEYLHWIRFTTELRWILNKPMTTETLYRSVSSKWTVKSTVWLQAWFYIRLGHLRGYWSYVQGSRSSASCSMLGTNKTLLGSAICHFCLAVAHDSTPQSVSHNYISSKKRNSNLDLWGNTWCRLTSVLWWMELLWLERKRNSIG